MTSRVAVVTGATGGIGKEIARGLARLGASVVIAVRDLRRGEATRADIAAQIPGADIQAMPLDVADQTSVRAFAATLRDRVGELHVLVNNAGVWLPDWRRSPDGHELTFATNVLGPHLLTELLLDPLRAAGQARVVNIVSSMAGHFDATDLEFTRRPFDGYQAYAQSKQALRMLTWGLAPRLAGTGVTVNAAAPGFVRTDAYRNVRGFSAKMMALSARFFAVSPAKGADTPLWASVAPELDRVTGRYFVNRTERDGRFREPGPIADLERRCVTMERAHRDETPAGEPS